MGEKDDKVTALYTLYGSAIGHTTLTATAKLPNGQIIYSPPTPVEVRLFVISENLLLFFI